MNPFVIDFFWYFSHKCFLINHQLIFSKIVLKQIHYYDDETLNFDLDLFNWGVKVTK